MHLFSGYRTYIGLSWQPVTVVSIVDIEVSKEQMVTPLNGCPLPSSGAGRLTNGRLATAVFLSIGISCKVVFWESGDDGVTFCLLLGHCCETGADGIAYSDTRYRSHVHFPRNKVCATQHSSL